MCSTFVAKASTESAVAKTVFNLLSVVKSACTCLKVAR